MNNTTGKKLAIWGAWLQLGVVFGLVGTVIGMIRAFGNLAESGETANADILASDISFALWTTIIGLIPSIFGVLLMAVALFTYKYRAPWFFNLLIGLSVIWLMGFPVGTILGILLLSYLISRKDEFGLKSSAPADSI